MGDAADDLFDREELLYHLHLAGECGEWGMCGYCVAEELESLDDFDEVTKPKEEISMANQVVKGVVEKINKNAGGFYGVLIADTWYGAGKYAPKFKEGDEIQFEFTKNKNYNNLVFGTEKVIEEGTGPAATASDSGAGGGAKATNWDLKDKRIAYQGSRNSALKLVELALDHDCITLPTKKADRFFAIEELVLNITNQYYEAMYNDPFSHEEE
jgi:hypothetical protein